MEHWGMIIGGLWVATPAVFLAFFLIKPPNRYQQMASMPDAEAMRKLITSLKWGPYLTLDTFYITAYTSLGISQLLYVLKSHELGNSVDWVCYTLFGLAIVAAMVDILENISTVLAFRGSLQAAEYVRRVQRLKVALPAFVIVVGAVLALVALANSRMVR
jgi:hypothetical protein